MIGRVLAVAILLTAMAGCATSRAPSALPVGAALRLAAIDGVPADDRSFQLRFKSDSSYVAAFDCGHHFGTYRYGTHLVLSPGASTGRTCDQIDLATGKPLAYDRSLANQFFADPDFTVQRQGRSTVLRNGRHAFSFVMIR